MLTNYHTHCELCKHAGGSVLDYAEQAAKNGFDRLGMSDHIPYPDIDYGMRMDYSNKDLYLDKVMEARQLYNERMEILSGFEAEYLPMYNGYYEELLKDNRCDYLILGVHFFQLDNGKLQSTYNITDTSMFIEYANKAVEAMRTGYFKCLCHPDLIGVGDFDIDENYKRAFDIIIDGATKYDFALEYNANGLRRGVGLRGTKERLQYPISEFWNMVEETDIKVLVGCDCHNPMQLYDECMKEALEYVGGGRFNQIFDVLG